MATTITVRSGDCYLINSTVALTVGASVTVNDGGLQVPCTVVKTYVGTRMYVVRAN